ncbi:hypothetical protein IW140_001259 [Coemansia sp. RSA 1813]|nr:hypothetical protein EV178_001151 [Coemansia sp. RSA 1646]KAJ1771743.1 hypothetical protein LPJ74_002045 [Coemansia sp. RSA 1843]KAJ2091691.1 hypothetical protein IW138_001674 [Coemansia sp. RSA 986]KAJ2216906.1 hypothetical protein EV179_000940 [Coemansia sp. RSA 487]KAJ2571910.1 hypothetical protein IW140_001259 [Coemansia sp. RSA 1813]
MYGTKVEDYLFHHDGDDSLCRPVKGLPTDHDHAISVDQDSIGNGIISGTLRYMSIHNMESAPGKRSALNDWELLLYLICWFGTFGINSEDRANIDKDKTTEIGKWQCETMQDIAHCKRNQIDNIVNFSRLILARFQEECLILQPLATNIYMVLFQHDGYEGTYFDTQNVAALYSYALAFVNILNEPQGGQSSIKQPKPHPLAGCKEYDKEATVNNLLKAIRAVTAVSEDFFLQKATAQGSEATPSQ